MSSEGQLRSKALCRCTTSRPSNGTRTRRTQSRARWRGALSSRFEPPELVGRKRHGLVVVERAHLPARPVREPSYLGLEIAGPTHPQAVDSGPFSVLVAVLAPRAATEMEHHERHEGPHDEGRARRQEDHEERATGESLVHGDDAGEEQRSPRRKSGPLHVRAEPLVEWRRRAIDMVQRPELLVDPRVVFVGVTAWRSGRAARHGAERSRRALPASTVPEHRSRERRPPHGSAPVPTFR
jgi:hypothetical protein